MESPGGELLIVRNRTYFPVRNGRFTKTMGFYIFKLGGLKDSPSWIRVESLGDEMLFVGTSGAISVPAANFSSGLFKGNCIYFTDDHFATLIHIPLSFGCHDSGVFNLEDGSITSFFPTDSHSSLCPPIWFMPS